MTEFTIFQQNNKTQKAGLIMMRKSGRLFETPEGFGLM
jgi:hypothetical protein